MQEEIFTSSKIKILAVSKRKTQLRNPYTSTLNHTTLIKL